LKEHTPKTVFAALRTGGLCGPELDLLESIGAKGYVPALSPDFPILSDGGQVVTVFRPKNLPPPPHLRDIE